MTKEDVSDKMVEATWATALSGYACSFRSIWPSMKKKKTAILKMSKKETFPTLYLLDLYVQSVQRISDSFGTKSWWWWLLV